MRLKRGEMTHFSAKHLVLETLLEFINSLDPQDSKVAFYLEHEKKQLAKKLNTLIKDNNATRSANVSETVRGE